MKKLTEHLHDEMLIAQIIYKFNVNLSRRSCFKYFVEDEVWLNACNLSITHFIIKLDDHNVKFFKIKQVLWAYQDWIKLVNVSSSDLTQSLFSFINISLFNIIFLSTSHSTRVINTSSSSLTQSLNIT